MKNIIFDLGGVVIEKTPISILDNRNINQNDYGIIRIFFDNWTNLNLGNETLEEKFNKCNFKKDIVFKYKDLLVNYYKYRLFNKDLIELIKKLKQDNYKIYVLSDNNKEATNYYKKILNDYFDGWVVSCDYKTVKKDGRLFEIMLEKYNLKPNECFFIDDNTVNVEVAKRYGIKGFVYNENDNITKLYECMIDNGIKLE